MNQLYYLSKEKTKIHNSLHSINIQTISLSKIKKSEQNWTKNKCKPFNNHQNCIHRIFKGIDRTHTYKT